MQQPEPTPAEERTEPAPRLGMSRALFPLGRIVATPGALAALGAAGTSSLELLERHVTGDWGELDDPDQRENWLAVRQGFRVLSAYRLPRTGAMVWVISEADRSGTTFLLPEEY